MDYGSVCQSILEKYQHDIACLSSTATKKDSEKESEESLEDSLEEGIEDSLEESPEESLAGSLDDSLEENLVESPVSDEQSQDETNTYTEPSLDCTLTNNSQSPEKLHDQTEIKIRTIVSSLKKHPLFEGDVLSKDLSTAALILTFKPGSNPESDGTQNLSLIHI